MRAPQLCRVGPLAALALLLGCPAVGPDYVPPEIAVPDEWRRAVEQDLAPEDPASSVLATWWTALGDPQLDGLIEEATAANLDLRVAVARVAQARRLREFAGGAFQPTLDARASGTVLEASDNNPFAQGRGLGRTDVWSAGLDASWELDVFGRIRRNVEVADARLDASIEDYRDVLVALQAEVAAAYVDARTSQERLAYARSNAESQRDTLQLTRDRFDAGLTSALDVAQAESNLANTESQIPELERALEFALNRVAVLLGTQPGSVHPRLAEPGPIPSPPAELTAGLPADLLRRRPDVRAAERRLAQATAQVGVATANLYPRFSLFGTLGLESDGLGDLFEGDSVTWNAGGSVGMPIFQGGRLRALVGFQEAQTEQALRLYEQAVLLALEEVENSLAAYGLERDRLGRLAEAAAASERAVELVRTQYTSGLTNFQNYLDSQRSLFQQQDQLAASQGQVVQNLIALNRALGGGWPAENAEEHALAVLEEADRDAGTEDEPPPTETDEGTSP